VTFVRAGIRGLDRATREHALLLACLCGLILLLGFPLPQGRWLALNWANHIAERDEAALDSALKDAATNALNGRDGTIIVLDAHTGRVRALVNPRVAYMQAEMPGSAMKPFTALTALRLGLIDEDSRSVCPGRFTGLSFSLPCTHADHLPPFSPAQAIAYSCNYYFATLGQRLGREKLVATAREFGFGQPTGLAAGDEVAGLLRPCETGSSSRVREGESNHVSTQADCEAREAIGESDLIQVTPIQLLTAYTALVNGGHLFRPEVGSAEDFRPVGRAQIDIAAQHRSVIVQGMAGALRYGTARNAKLDTLPLTILGKTGTAMPAKGFRTNGWFIGFAGPFQSNRELDESQVELAVLVLLPRAHGSEAAAAARPIFEAYAAVTNGKDQGNGKQPDAAHPDPAIPNSKSAIKVHLVHDNVTEELSLEDYVLGVMRAEGTMESEPEALKALAIAIRTFAIKNRGRHAKDGYDFCSTTHCQRFVVRGPNVSEGAIGNGDLLLQAVRSTEGQVLLDDQNQIVDSYFGASCGGETANIADLWGVTPPDYLRGVRDEYCVSAPHAHWTDLVTRANLLRALQSDVRTDVGNRLDQILVSKHDETGRAEFITLEGEHRKTVRGWDFKIIVGRVLGWNVLKSSRFEITRSGSNFIFRGSGFGHGLGLCQEGAHVMAARGASYQKILEKYFPGTRVLPRSGMMSLARPFKAGNRQDEPQFVASATIESAREKSQLKQQRTGWRADLLTERQGALGIPRGLEPRSGEIFVAAVPPKNHELRMSETFSVTRINKPSNVAATELMHSFGMGIYKYFAPLGLNPGTKLLTISSEHFRVTYPGEVDRRDADQVLNTLEAARSDFARRASSASISTGIPTLDIRLNESTGDFTSRTGQPWWAAAATKGNHIELQPFALLKRRGVLTTTLRHELAHVFIDAISQDRAPRWLEEGFAIYLAGEGRLFAHYTRGGNLSNDELERRLEHPRTQSDMRELYAQAYLSVSEIVRQQGEASVWKKLATG
jgi:SpoIID/LytB domain protein